MNANFISLIVFTMYNFYKKRGLDSEPFSIFILSVFVYINLITIIIFFFKIANNRIVIGGSWLFYTSFILIFTIYLIISKLTNELLKNLIYFADPEERKLGIYYTIMYMIFTPVLFLLSTRM